VLIVLDTNIIISDLLMRKTGFEILKDYAVRTDSRIVLPRIALEELAAHYRRVVEEMVETHRRQGEKLNRTLLRPATPPVVVDVDLAVNEYVQHVRTALSLTESSIIDYGEANLRDAISRAVTRRRPCTDNGEEVRDSLLWSSLLDYAATVADTVVFISANTKQFARDGMLHPALAEELTTRNIHVEYLTSLDEFAKHHAARIAFVTSEWVEVEIGGDYVIDQVRDAMMEVARDVVVSRTRAEYDDVDDLSVSSAFLEVDEFFVYVMGNGEMRLQVQWFGHAEIEYTSRVERVAILGGMRYQPYRSHVDLRVSVTTEGIIRDNHVTEWNVVDTSIVEH